MTEKPVELLHQIVFQGDRNFQYDTMENDE